MKKLCKLKDEIPANVEYILTITTQPKFICMKCGRITNNKETVCNPDKIKKYLPDKKTSLKDKID